MTALWCQFLRKTLHIGASVIYLTMSFNDRCPKVLHVALEQLFIEKKLYRWNIQSNGDNVYVNLKFGDPHTPTIPGRKHNYPSQIRGGLGRDHYWMDAHRVEPPNLLESEHDMSQNDESIRGERDFRGQYNNSNQETMLKMGSDSYHISSTHTSINKHGSTEMDITLQTANIRDHEIKEYKNRIKYFIAHMFKKVVLDEESETLRGWSSDFVCIFDFKKTTSEQKIDFIYKQ